MKANTWQGTVMTLDQYNMFEFDFHQTNNIMELYSKCEFLNHHETEKLKRQAEIAFKAGQQSVVEWVEKNDMYRGSNSPTHLIERDKWQAFLKEKGL